MKIKDLSAVKISLFRSCLLFLCALLVASTSSTYYVAAKQFITGDDQRVSIKNPLIALDIGDSAMYILQSYSFSVNLNLLSENESSDRLRDAGLDISSPSTRDLMYLAHVDKSRILYPLLSALGRTLFGDYSFLIINLLCLFGIFHLMTSKLKKLNYISLSLISLLVFSPFFNIHSMHCLRYFATS